jgi:transglutaminase-like putative cysteine protease
MNYRVSHRTVYHYAAPVSSSYGEVYLLPRDRPGQVCHGTDVTIEPAPDFYRERVDSFGNNVGYFELLAPHRRLAVTAHSLVLVESRPPGLPLVANQPWEECRPTPESTGDGDLLDARQFVLESTLVSTSTTLRRFGHASFTAGRPVLEALTDLTERIHDRFAYLPGATSVGTTAEQVLSKGEGVCQDFAHVAIGCLRSLGLAARYVSGYLETDPPPGAVRLEGADVSHAWASLFVPGAGWVDFDPTNRQLVTDRYLTTAWGRDYVDVPPLKGVIFTDGRAHDLEVAVDVIRVEGR